MANDGKAEVIADAYRLMAMDAEGHIWSKFARAEVDAILARFPLTPGARIVDVGCGSGRHSLEFASRGFRVKGFDFVSAWIERAKQLERERHEEIEQSSGDVKFEAADARDIPLMEGNDLVVCLYDVLGSSHDIEDARRVIQGLFRLCKPGRSLVLGCMNGMQMARRIEPQCMTIGKPALLEMKPLSAMQRCGEVFNFEDMRYDPQTGVLYRREQFKEGDRVIRDLLIEERRFLPVEVVQLLAEAGFQHITVTGVRAGQWNFQSSFDPDCPEVVYTAQRPDELMPSVPRLPKTKQSHATSYSLRLIPRAELDEQHAAIVSRIFCSSFGKNPKTGKPHVLGPVRMWERLKRCSYLCLALKNDIPVGYMFGTAYLHLRKFAWLDSICVMREFRRQGLATAMLDAFARAVPAFEWLGATSPNPITKLVLQKAQLGHIYGPGEPAPDDVIDALDFIQRDCEDLRNCEIDRQKMLIKTRFSVEYGDQERTWDDRDAVAPPWWRTLANLPEDFESLLIIRRGTLLEQA